MLIFPPLLFGGTLVFGLLLHWLHPLSISTSWAVRLVGPFLIIASGLLALSAEAAMKRAGTNVRPDKPTLAIVRDGPFQFSRNPLYLAATGLYIGIALLLNMLWPLILLIPTMVVLRWGVIAREERYLEAKFGDAYLSYKSRVRRWI